MLPRSIWWSCNLGGQLGDSRTSETGRHFAKTFIFISSINLKYPSYNNSIIYETPVTYVPTTAPFDMMQFSEASTIEGTEFKLDWYNTNERAQVAWIEIDYTGIILTVPLSGS